MSEPTTAAEVRERIRGDKDLEYRVVLQIRLQRLKAHERDTQSAGARLYDDDLFPDAVDIVKAYQTAIEVISMNGQ
jgi:hypothetical protein